MQRLQRVWHASRERLPFRTPGPFPFWGGRVHAQIIETSFPEFAVTFLDFSPWVPLGKFSISVIDIESPSHEC